jgi:hypothetical protein
MLSMRSRGDVIKKIVTNSGAHNTIVGVDGKRGVFGWFEIASPARGGHAKPTR